MATTLSPQLKPHVAQPSLLAYLVLGTLFGVVLIKAEIVSWFRIQEMFRFHSFHMYGIIGSALAVAASSVALIRRFKLRALSGDDVMIPPREMGTGRRYLFGGTIFGVGWALTGACPGPLVALIGAGVSIFIVALLAAVGGTWLYGVFRPHLPH